MVWTFGCCFTPQRGRVAPRYFVACPASLQISTIVIHLNLPHHSLRSSNSTTTRQNSSPNLSDSILTFEVAIMGMKRKHIDEESPVSISSFGAVSTPDALSPTQCPQGMVGAMDMEMDTESLPRSNGWDFTRAHRTKSSDWGNRTRKRVRDNRPDERAIHGTSSLPFRPDTLRSKHVLIKSRKHSPQTLPRPTATSPRLAYPFRPSTTHTALHNCPETAEIYITFLLEDICTAGPGAHLFISDYTSTKWRARAAVRGLRCTA